MARRIHIVISMKCCGSLNLLILLPVCELALYGSVIIIYHQVNFSRSPTTWAFGRSTDLFGMAFHTQIHSTQLLPTYSTNFTKELSSTW